MTILWVVLIVFTVCLGLVGLFMGSATKTEVVEVKEETYSEQLVRWRKEAQDEERKKFLATIREPVFSFLRTFEQNPKRFKVKRRADAPEGIKVYDTIEMNDLHTYSMIDTETGEEFKFLYHRTRAYKGHTPITMLTHEWLERNELKHIYENMRMYFNVRASRRLSILMDRKDRILQGERARLTAIYGGSIEAVNNKAKP